MFLDPGGGTTNLGMGGTTNVVVFRPEAFLYTICKIADLMKKIATLQSRCGTDLTKTVIDIFL